MSIEFSPAFDSGRCSLGGLVISPSRPRPASPRRVAANRRNARKSTGPRTAAGKRRSSRNALKHGLCSTSACLPSECQATYQVFMQELREELRPRTILQKSIFPHLCQLLWRLDRIPAAQNAIFQEELHKAANGETLTPAEVIARRFSDDPTTNGFAHLSRYERQHLSQFLRLLRQYHGLQKHHSDTPWPEGEPPLRDPRAEPAWTEEKAEAQRRWFQTEAGQAELRRIDEAARKRTQSNPTPTFDSVSETPECDAERELAGAERTHSTQDAPAPVRR